MEWLIKASAVLFWIMDILNMPWMTQFDTTYPLNGWFWVLVWIFILG